MLKPFQTHVLIALLLIGLNLSPAAEEPTSRPATEGELRNATCPFTGKETDPARFVEYADPGKKVFARLYFCCGNCQSNASKMDTAALRPHYEKAYLSPEERDPIKYGNPALVLKNDHCPVTGNPADGSVHLNYNATQVNLCCPGCDEAVVEQPDKYLHNVNNDIDAARQAEEDADAG